MRPTGKSFRFVSCVRAVCMSSEIGEKISPWDLSLFPFFSLPFPFSLSRLAPGPFKNMVLWLIRTLMAPNLDPRASPGSFFQAGSPGKSQIQPSCQKWAEKIRDLGRDFFWIFGFSPNGKPRPWLDRSRPGESKNTIFEQKTEVCVWFFAISNFLQLSLYDLLDIF